jgi:hypothetical protein
MTDDRSQADVKAARPWPVYALGAFAVVMILLLINEGNVLYHAAEGAQNTQHVYLLFWASFNLVVALFGLLYVLFPRASTSQGAPLAPTKMLILSIGGLFGLSLTILGIMYGILWWNAATGGLFSGRDAWKGGPTWEHYRPYIVLALILGGLAFMLVSILVVRSEERTNPTLRRLVYGYITVFSGLMLFAVLGATNVLAFFYVQENGLDPFDWTRDHVYSLSPSTKQILKDLPANVVVYVLVSPADPLYADIKTLLSNFRSVTDKVEAEYINPGNPFAVAALLQQYSFTGREGVLVVYDPEGKPNYQFLKPLPDLEGVSSRGPMGAGGEERTFKGEQAIVSAINSLREGKIKKVVYFTQDSGELALDSFESQDPDIGLGRLASLLKEDNLYEVKPLSLATVAKVPDDAMAVVVAGPRQPLTPKKVDVLRDYMKNNGKLIVLVDTFDQTPLPTGLEKFLEEYGVQVGQDMILNGIDPEAPTACFLRLAPNCDMAFRESFRGLPFLAWSEARSVRPNISGPADYAASPLFVTAAAEDRFQWAEEKPREILKNKEAFEKKATERSQPIPVAATVRDKKSADSEDVHAQGKPRLLVFGDATWVSNAYMGNQRAGRLYYLIFTSSLGWLRERYDIVTTVEPKTRKFYRVTIPPERKLSLMIVPGLVVTGAVIACGIGVLLMRRR